MPKIDLSLIDLEDLPEDNVMEEKKKKVNSKRKGSKFELEIAKHLSSEFKDTFRRVPQSGAIVGGLNRIYNGGLREDAQEIFAGDIICPKWFPFCIEAKNYANTPKMVNLLSIGDKGLDGWIKQAQQSAQTANKEWIIFFKITEGRKSFACLDENLFFSVIKEQPKKFIIYNKTVILDYKNFIDRYISKFFPLDNQS